MKNILTYILLGIVIIIIIGLMTNKPQDKEIQKMNIETFNVEDYTITKFEKDNKICFIFTGGIDCIENKGENK